MDRKQFFLGKQLVLATAFGLCASGAAMADDNSMSPLTGDSYAAFNGLDYHPGGFNTKRVPQAAKAQAQDPAPIAKLPKTDEAKDTRIMLATPRSFDTPTNPFNDNTGA